LLLTKAIAAKVLTEAPEAVTILAINTKTIDNSNTKSIKVYNKSLPMLREKY